MLCPSLAPPLCCCWMSLNKTHKLNYNTVVWGLVILFVVYDSFMWKAPLCLHCISCTLQEVILTLRKNLTEDENSGRSSAVSIKYVRKCHRQLCETLTFADKVFSLILLVIIFLDIPLVCSWVQLADTGPLIRIFKHHTFISITYWCLAVTTTKLWFYFLLGAG